MIGFDDCPSAIGGAADIDHERRREGGAGCRQESCDKGCGDSVFFIGGREVTFRGFDLLVIAQVRREGDEPAIEYEAAELQFPLDDLRNKHGDVVGQFAARRKLGARVVDLGEETFIVSRFVEGTIGEPASLGQVKELNWRLVKSAGN